jgi:hypothetical protein
MLARQGLQLLVGEVGLRDHTVLMKLITAGNYAVEMNV